jgi:hypothetical protein
LYNVLKARYAADLLELPHDAIARLTGRSSLILRRRKLLSTYLTLVHEDFRPPLAMYDTGLP